MSSSARSVARLAVESTRIGRRLVRRPGILATSIVPAKAAVVGWDSDMFIRRWKAQQVGTHKIIEEPVNYYYFFKFNARRNVRLMNEVADHWNEASVYKDSNYKYVLVNRLTKKEVS